MRGWKQAMCASAFVAVSAITGCQQKAASMEDMMQPPPRPAELDKLNVFVGTWESTGEMRMAGSDEVMQHKGTNTVSWDCDNRVLFERFEASMEGESPFKGIGVWSYDSGSGRYRIYWFDSFGSTNTGWATHDEKTDTWHFKGQGNMGGKTSVIEGTARMIDKNTMEWSHIEWDSWKLKKMMEMKGTSRRK
ncbi:MAG: DUF1579 family protein [Phycisphaerales bacterium]|nr:DUF1579 family protein [Phycisphaerales bacterium]